MRFKEKGVAQNILKIICISDKYFLSLWILAVNNSREFFLFIESGLSSVNNDIEQNVCLREF